MLDWIKKPSSAICCPQETQIKYEDTNMLTSKGQRKKIPYHANTNQEKVGISQNTKIYMLFSVPAMRTQEMRGRKNGRGKKRKERKGRKKSRELEASHRMGKYIYNRYNQQRACIQNT